MPNVSMEEKAAEAAKMASEEKLKTAEARSKRNEEKRQRPKKPGEVPKAYVIEWTCRRCSGGVFLGPVPGSCF